MTNYYNSLCIGRDTAHKKTKFGVSGGSPNTTKTSRWWLASLFMVMSFFAEAAVTPCPSATAIPAVPTLPYVASLTCGTTNDITSANSTTCGNGSYKGGNEAVFVWTPTDSYTGVSIGYTGVTWTGIFVYNGCPTTGGTCVGNITNSGSSKTLSGLSITAGNTYYIVFDTWPTPNSPCAGTMTLNGSIVLPQPPNCATALVPADLTSDIARNPTLSWTAATGGPSSYDVYFGSATSPALVGNQTALTYSPGLLDANTTYYWNIIAKNAFGDAVGCVEQSFTTGTSFQYCAAVPSSMDNNGITNVVLGSLSNPNVSLTTYQNFTTGLPVPDLAQSTTASIDVTYATGYTYNTHVFIDFNQDGDFADAGEDNYIGLSASTNPTTISGSIVVPSDALLGQTRMRVVGSDNDTLNNPCYSGSYANVEDYTVNITLPPTCLPPSALAVADVTGNSATINWDCVGCTGTFELDYGLAGHTAGTGTIVTGATSGYALSSLNATTAHTVYVRQDCGGGSYSPWSTVNFTTTLDCAAAIVLTADVAVTSGSLATTGGVYNNNACGFGTPGKEALYSFTTTTAGTYILTISNVNGGFGYIDYMYKDASLGCGPTGWTCIDDNSATGTDSMTLLAGTTYYILLDAEGTTGTANHTFSIGQAALVPGCATLDLPADASTDVDSATVTLSWTAPAVTATEGAATSYKVYFGTVNPPLTLASSPATTSYTRTGLAYSTTYYWSVTSVNSGGDAVGCTDVYSFTTEADPCTGVVPTGDTFADPIVLGALVNGTPTTSAGDNLATNCWHDDYTTSSTPGNGSARPGRDIFYQFEIADLCNSLTVATCGASFDTYLHILDATGTRVAFNDDGCGTSSTLTTSTLVPGIYYAVVDGYNATSEGTFTLSFDYTSTPSVTYYADADGDTFGDATGNPVELCAPATGFVTNNLDCDDTNPAVNPDATEIAYDGIDNNCDGQLDEGFPPQSTTLKPGSCGVTLAGLDTVISATPVSGATDYRYKVTNGMEVQTYETTRPWFRLTYLPNYDYATTYTVEVEIKKGGVWLGYYGDPCTVTTPAISSSLLSFQSPMCGSTLASVDTLLLMNGIPRATGYRFEVTQGATTEVFDTASPYFRLGQLTMGYVYGTTYSVRIAVKTGASGVYTSYGSACEFTTPDVPQIAECGTTVVAGSIVTVPSLTGVTTYTYEVTTPSGIVTINRSVPYFIVNSISIPGYTSTTEYSVRVSLTTAGGVSPWSDSCSINPAAAAAVRYSNTVSNEFKANGFPNPFTNNFTLDITTTSEEKVSVMVYDMIGKLLDRVEVNATDRKSVV